MNMDPWGLGYKIVTRKLGASAREGPQDAERMQNIVDADVYKRQAPSNTVVNKAFV